MIKIYKIEDLNRNEIKHADVDMFEFDRKNKRCLINMCHVGLLNGTFLYDCTITITDWWDLEVYSYNRQEIVKHYSLDEIPEIDSILDFSYNNDELILEDCGMNNTAVAYKFTQPKIQITGEYKPD